MSNKSLWAIPFSLLSVLTYLAHLIIPIVCFVAVIILFKRQIIHLKTARIISILLVILTLSSYFVGVCANPKINNTSLSIPKQEDYFYLDSDDNSFSYYGKVFICKSEELLGDYTDIFSDEQLFDADLSNIGKFILNHNIGLKKESTDDGYIIYSPLVLCENNFMNGRNNYAGYILIEDKNNKDNIVFIPYKLYFKETLYNNLTFTEIYSKKYQININGILNSIVTEEQYFNNIYS